jgi:fructose-specific phosphotransferase system IIC component
MRERYIPAFIMLLAGAITSIFNIVNHVPVYDALKRLLIVLIIFYILGLIVKGIIVKLIINASVREKELQEEKEDEGSKDTELQEE